MLVNGELNSAQIEGFAFADLPDPTLMLRRIVVDSTNKRALISDGVQWRPTGSSGGGSSLNWVEDAKAPLNTIEDGVLKYLFAQMEGQSLKSGTKIPTLYVGSQIKFKFDIESPDNSGNVTFNVISTLIRQSIDLMSSVANQETFSQTVNLGVGTVGIPQEIVATLTDVDGKINGIAVLPGDYVKIEVKRDTGDMATSEAKVAIYLSELSFD